jgi:magnesium-transporting ATPase (P-type)
VRDEFNSARKRMSSVVLLSDHFRAYVKGAGVGARLVHARAPRGRFDHVIEMANDAMRTMLLALAFAFAFAFADLDGLRQSAVEARLTVIGVAGIVDRLRRRSRTASRCAAARE